MDYEKKYKDALSRARSMYESQDDAELAAHIFPELRESEVERIREGIVETIKQCPDTFLNPKNRDEMLAYLEKQKEATCFAELMNKLTATEQEVMFNAWPKEEKEQKPVEWSEADKEAFDMCIDAIPKAWKTKNGILLTKWLKDNIHLQSKQEWSEEDEKMLKLCEDFVSEFHSIEAMQVKSWLKSLRARLNAK